MIELMKFWPIVLFIVGAIGWLLRLEARGINNSREIKRLWEVRKEDQRHNELQMSEIKADLTTIMSDIKRILERGMKR